MADYQNVHVAVTNRVALLTIDHPPANAFDTQTMKDLEAAFDEVTANDDVKVIVITGAGQFAFVAGADVNEIAQLAKAGDAANARSVIQRGQLVFSKIEASKKPVIAAINAVALGGGLELAMACHMRIISQRARVGQPEMNLGIIPGWGGTQRLARLVGRGKATEMILTGDMITAQEAFRIGLVNKVVPPGSVLKEATGLARKLASKSAVAMAAALAAIDEGLKEPDVTKGLEHELDHFVSLIGTHDMQEGVDAFLHKRRPTFTDN